ncbi:MAG: methyltransferase domain-containing protein [Thermoplasmata archaeon]|jgi:SAM-dependent methyltransferase
MTGLPGWVNIDADPLIRFRFALRSLQPLLRRGLLPFSPTTFDYYLQHPLPPGYVYWNFARKPLPFADSSVSAVFSSHTLEHLPRFLGRKVVRDVRRALRPEGVFRISVPDLELMARQYLASIEHDGGGGSQTVARPITAREVNFEFYRGRAGYHIEPQTRFDVFDFEGLYGKLFGVRGHMYMYDYADLRSLLMEAGFTRVERRVFGEGDCPDAVALDSRPGESLFVEAYP